MLKGKKREKWERERKDAQCVYIYEHVSNYINNGKHKVVNTDTTLI